MVYKYNYKGQRENYAPRAVAEEENKDNSGSKSDAGKQIGMHIGIAVGVVAVVGLAYYFYSKKKESSVAKMRFGFEMF
jgi:hypothetical protein